MCVEADEFRSDVGDTSNQRWTWYALERTSGTILADQNGKRTDAICLQLLEKLAGCPIRYYDTDHWQS
jgi:insertion element IS1 protein InsB